MITTQQMTQLEESSEKKGVSKLDLMENAGKAVVNVLGDDVLGQKIVIFCYQGNNSGDGFVVARLIADKSNVTVLFLGKEEKLTKEAKINFEKIKNNKKIKIIQSIDNLEDDYDIVIDAMLGTGAIGNLREPIKSAVIKYNQMKGKKISLDIPTGLNPDTGKVEDICCSADLIITFHDAKTGLKALMDKVKIVDIGIES